MTIYDEAQQTNTYRPDMYVRMLCKCCKWIHPGRRLRCQNQDYCTRNSINKRLSVPKQQKLKTQIGLIWLLLHQILVI